MVVAATKALHIMVSIRGLAGDMSLQLVFNLGVCFHFGQLSGVVAAPLKAHRPGGMRRVRLKEKYEKTPKHSQYTADYRPGNV